MFRIILTSLLFAATLMAAYKDGSAVDEPVLEALGGKGRIIVVDFFASWCHSCKEELPLVNTLAGHLNPAQVRLVGVNVDNKPEKGAEFVRELGVKFDVIYDPQKKIVGKFGPIGMPAIYYINAEGVVVKRRIGALNNIDRIILQDLAELGYEPKWSGQ